MGILRCRRKNVGLVIASGHRECRPHRRGAEAGTRRIQEAHARMAELTGEGSSDDALVEAVTDAEGQLKEITVNPRIMRLGSEAVARGVMEAVQRAQQDAKAKAKSLLTRVQPLDSAIVDERIAEIADELARHERGLA
ncbi:YbaB/EbfC family nucleoid-associated protein [Nonomuraea sp. NPDC000554]|uniref:YbaB/EbfC family nucleoid-associated protein n=1 Tax=Nonomuraea sp. NPDC000554 TaxID=3154259 RepID=UPI00332A62E7